MENVFNSFESKAPEFEQLGECTDHEVRIARIGSTDSFTQLNGESKPNLPVWADKTPQMYAIFVSTSGKGSIVHRFNGLGYGKRKDVSDEEFKSGAYEIEKNSGYLLSKNDDGQMVRRISAENSANCNDIFNQFFNALQMPVGSTIANLDKAIEDQMPLLVTVTKDSWTNPATQETTDQYRAGRFRKTSASAVKAEMSASDAEDLV